MEGQGSVGAKLLEKMETKGDVTFLVGPEGKEEEIKSVVFVLSAFSTVFETMFNDDWKSQQNVFDTMFNDDWKSQQNVFDTMFNDDWKSQQNVIKLPDIDPKMFRLFLKLVFTDNVKDDHLNSAEMDMEDILHLLYIAKKYDVKTIQSICRNAVRSRLDVKNAVVCYETLQNMDETELEKTSFYFIIAYIEPLLEEDSFTKLSLKSLTSILNCETLSVRELSLFKAVCRWAEFQCPENDMEKIGENIRKMLGDLLFLIRFPVMTIQEFYKTVPPMGILTLEEIFEISSYMSLKGDSSVANNSPFSAEGRPNVKNPFLVSIHPDFDQCFVYTPSDDISLSRVQVISSCTHARSSGTHWSSSDYSLRLCITDGIHGILPNAAKFYVPHEELSFDLETTIKLEKNKSYCIYYEIQGQYSTLPARIVVRGDTLQIRMQRC